MPDRAGSTIPCDRVDERDTMFARMARLKGTAAYGEYYSRHPERQAVDDRLRSLPELCAPGGKYYDPVVSRDAERYSRQIGSIRPDETLIAAWQEKMSHSGDPTALLKRLALSLGAVAAGCTTLDEEFLYSHKGRFDVDFGNPVDLRHPWVLVFLVEMDWNAMQHAPRAEVIRESTRQYYRGAIISLTIAALLSACGHEARSHHDAHYDAILPPLAVRAGLGELGRNNILIAGRYGSRVRLGAVSTTLLLAADRPVDLGAGRLCEVCNKCAANCPSNALSRGERTMVRGVAKWPTNAERCYAYWRTVGTDCGMCMAVCPFSHRDSRLHNAVRWAVRRAPWTRRALVLLDGLVYGRRWKRPSVGA